MVQASPPAFEQVDVSTRAAPTPAVAAAPAEAPSGADKPYVHERTLITSGADKPYVHERTLIVMVETRPLD